MPAAAVAFIPAPVPKPVARFPPWRRAAKPTPTFFRSAAARVFARAGPDLGAEPLDFVAQDHDFVT